MRYKLIGSKLYRQWKFYATRNLFNKYVGGGVEFRRSNKFGRARIFMARAIRS